MSKTTRKPGTGFVPAAVRDFCNLTSTLTKESRLDLEEAVLSLERSFGCSSVFADSHGRVVLEFDPDTLKDGCRTSKVPSDYLLPGLVPYSNWSFVIVYQ